MTVYSVKYLFTKGIQVLEDCAVHQTDPGRQYAKRGSIGHADNVFQRIGLECFLTLEEARAKAMAMALRKQTALEKQLSRVRDLRADLTQ